MNQGRSQSPTWLYRSMKLDILAVKLARLLRSNSYLIAAVHNLLWVMRRKSDEKQSVVIHRTGARQVQRSTDDSVPHNRDAFPICGIRLADSQSLDFFSGSVECDESQILSTNESFYLHLLNITRSDHINHARSMFDQPPHRLERARPKGGLCHLTESGLERWYGIVLAHWEIPTVWNTGEWTVTLLESDKIKQDGNERKAWILLDRRYHVADDIQKGMLQRKVGINGRRETLVTSSWITLADVSVTEFDAGTMTSLSLPGRVWQCVPTKGPAGDVFEIGSEVDPKSMPRSHGRQGSQAIKEP